jgi:hypothetical protein
MRGVKILKHLKVRNISGLCQNASQSSISKSSRSFSSLVDFAPNSQIVATVFGATGFIGRYVVSRLCKLLISFCLKILLMF